MAIDFDKWTDEFGGEKAVKAVKEAEENIGDHTELPEGMYQCKLEKLELGESKKGKPMVKAMFRIYNGKHKRQCIFYNGVMVANDPSKSGYCIHNVLNFLRSLNIYDDSEIDFDGNYRDFNNLLLDIAEDAADFEFEVKTEKDGDYTRVTVTDTFE